MKKHFEAMKKAGLSLAVFAFISVLLVSMTDRLTHDKIVENQRLFLLNSLNQVVSKDQYDNDLLGSKVILPSQETGFPRDTPVYFATRNGKLVTAIFEVTTLSGYSGAIKLLVGINTAKNATKDAAKPLSISGVRVLEHTETPGLGDKVETNKSNWIFSFSNKSIGNPPLSGWAVKKDGGDFDQFTGATITPRAIVNAVRSTLLYAQDNLMKQYKDYTQREKHPITENNHE